MRRHVYLYEHAGVPFEFACRVWMDRPEILIEAGLDSASDRRAELVTDLVAHVGPLEFAREVTVELGEFRTHPNRADTCYRDFSWRASKTKSMFPVMEAELEAFGLAARLTQVSLVGSYEPPAGLVGGVADALVMHRVAEASLGEFLKKRMQALEATWAKERRVRAG